MAQQDWAHQKNGEIIYHLKWPSDMDSRAGVGLCHKKNLSVFHAARTKEKILFASTYRLNENGRREVIADKACKKHLILAGASFAFGTGLNDKETTGHHLYQTNKSYDPINIAVAGSGLNTMAALVDVELTPENVCSKEGKFVYIYNDFHVSRAIGQAMQRQWLWDSPVYSRDNLKYLGNFKKAQKYKTLFYEKTQKFLRFFGIKFNYPPLDEDDYDYACRLIARAKNDYERNFKGDFFVYDHPYSDMNSKMKECLVKKDISIIDSKIKWNKELHEIAYDEHPNEIGAKIVAEEISQSIWGSSND